MSQSLQVIVIPSQPFDENSYIAHMTGRDDCLIFDPGLEPEKIIQYVERHRLTPAAFVCTHGHADHIAGNAALKDRWPDCPLVIGAGDAPMLTNAELNLSAGFGMPVVSPPADQTVSEGDQLSSAGIDLEVFEIPGHSSGHAVFIYKGASPYQVFSGDVLFAGSVGRTDFPGGSFGQLSAGIRRVLFSLPDDTVILPGHGPATTVGHERRTNPFVGERAGLVDLN
jgi:glyoxylase-like metal-dependent hydrolase (beta-lactamase superfamily II)